jgi:hypothetical protein
VSGKIQLKLEFVDRYKIESGLDYPFHPTFLLCNRVWNDSAGRCRYVDLNVILENEINLGFGIDLELLPLVARTSGGRAAG